MSTTTKSFLLLTAILHLSSAAPIDGIMRNKFIHTRPGFDGNQAPRLLSGAGGLGHRYYVRIGVNELGNYLGQRHTYTYSRGPFAKGIDFYPYANFQSLRFGTKYEMYGFDKSIAAGANSYSSVMGFLGTREGNVLELLSVHGISSGQSIQQYNAVQHRQCKRKLFRKKCHTVTTHVPRGFNHQEITQIDAYLQHIAHNEVINRLPVSLSDQIEALEGMQMLGSGLAMNNQILYNVEAGNIMNSVNAMIGQSCNEYAGQVMGLVNSGRNGTVMVNKGGMFRVVVERTGGLWKVTVAR